ncbi:MAG: hypothetical protein HYU36_08470 [Planctomycetes bacterium]|nr:hypothetical protein [Planctomycetota bacterium]
MRIVVNHLTRMRPGRICVAGIDVSTGEHVRPVLETTQLGRDMLVRSGGPFDIASVADLGATRHVGKPPETEDHVFDPKGATQAKVVAADKFWKLLMKIGKPTLAGIFGPALEARTPGCAVDLGQGNASLGCLIPASAPEIWVDGWDKIRIELTDGTLTPNLSVTDLRLYEDDQKTPRRKLVERIATRIKKGVGVVVAVGLARPWQKPGDTERRHWLQVNNIHLEDDPAWQLG